MVRPVPFIYTIHTIIFWLKTASGADSVDFNVNKTTIGFQNPRGVWPNIYNTAANLTYTVNGDTYVAIYGTSKACTVAWEVGSGNLLDPNEKVRVTVDLTQLTMTQSTKSGVVLQNEQFKVIVKPPYGSVLDIVRNAPAQLTAVNDLS